MATTRTAIEPVLDDDAATQDDNSKENFSEDLNTASPMTVSVSEAMNPARRQAMEDCHVIASPGTWNAPDPALSYLAVYDGHGGREIADFLKIALSYHVAQELAVEDGTDIHTRLERAFLMADIHSREAGLLTSGATVALCLVKRDQLQPNRIQFTAANVGDARVVVSQHGKAVRLTHDHRLDDPLEVQRIEQAGGFIFKGRVLGVLAITRSLGDHMLKPFVIGHPYVQSLDMELADDDSEPCFVIVACDGLWDVMTDQEAVDLVRNFQGDKSDAAKKLVETALEKNTTDNVTAIVAWL